MPDPITYDPDLTVPVSAAMLAGDLRLRCLTVTDDGGSTVNPDDFAAQIIGGFLDDANRATAALPKWEDMSDLDKGAALLHLAKVENEGREYAIENYSAKYFEHPALTALDGKAASEHAVTVEDASVREPFEEWERLYDLALDADRKR
jgi:hypothetical protein